MTSISKALGGGPSFTSFKTSPLFKKRHDESLELKRASPLQEDEYSYDIHRDFSQRSPTDLGRRNNYSQ